MSHPPDLARLFPLTEMSGSGKVCVWTYVGHCPLLDPWLCSGNGTMVGQVCVMGPPLSSGERWHLQIAEEEFESLSLEHITMLFLVPTLFGCNPWHPTAGRTWAWEGFHAWLCRAIVEVQGYPKYSDPLHMGKLSCTHEPLVLENHRNRFTW